MGIKEEIDTTVSLLDQVRSKVSPEELDKVGSLLEQVKSRVKGHGDSWHATLAETMDRKEKLREYDRTIEKLNDELAKANSKLETFDTTELEQERDTYKEKYNSAFERLRKSLETSFDKIKDHPKWEKAQSQFKLPEIKDDKYDWGSLKPEDIEYNISKFDELQALEYFEISQTPGGPEGGKEQPRQVLDRDAIWEKRAKGDPSWRVDYEAYAKKQGYSKI